MKYIYININGREIKTIEGRTILEVAKENSIDIPSLCEVKELDAYGGCGLCVVEVEGFQKPLRACSTKVADGMIIKTHTDEILNSRKFALELILSDHVGDCKAPCYVGCPGSVDVQTYVGLIGNGEFKEALKVIKENLPLPASIGRVCPPPCPDNCKRGDVEESIQIAKLKRFAADKDLFGENPYIPELESDTGKKVAVIGGGPGGLSCAYYLAKKGHKVAVYESMPEFGGMLRYGIPLYRLPKDVLNKEIELIEKMGVKLIPNINVGKDISLDRIRKDNDAVYISIGAWESSSLRCPGTDLEGVYGGIDFLTRFAVNDPIRTGKRIAVIGGGNTAMDAARTSIRLGAEKVYAIYRRTKEDMPAVDIEIKEAEEEGVEFKFLLNPVEIVGDGKVQKIRVQKMEAGERDSRGRRSITPLDEYEEIEVDSVIVSIGQQIKNGGFDDLSKNKWGNILSEDGTMATNLDGVFAGGDCSNNGASIAIEAISDGRKAADSIDKYVKGEKVEFVGEMIVANKKLSEKEISEIPVAKAIINRHLEPEMRKHNFEEVSKDYDLNEALEEAKRCLECGCKSVNDCKLFDYGNDYSCSSNAFEGQTRDYEIEKDNPYLYRDMNKCILCGLCVRSCEQILDIEAVGLVGRGFDSNVLPALGKKLIDTQCISCSKCLSVCPTGALQEKQATEKEIPFSGQFKESVCNMCSVGCNVKVEYKGDLIQRVLPTSMNGFDENILCQRGKYEFGNRSPKLSAMLKNNDVIREADYKDALLYAAKKSQSINLLYGNNSIGIVISSDYTNEEAYIIKKLGEDVLNTKNIYTNSSKSKGIKDIMGYDASTNTLNQLSNTDYILLIGGDMYEDYLTVAMKIKNAVKKGAKLSVISNEKSNLDQYAEEKVDDEKILFQILKHIIKNCSGKYSDIAGYTDMVEKLKDLEVCEKAKSIASHFLNSNKAVIVFDQDYLSGEAAQVLAMISVISEHVGKAREGIVQLKKGFNSQGIIDMGYDSDYENFVNKIDNGEIKGILSFGCPVDKHIYDKVDFVFIHDEKMADSSKNADVFIPKTPYIYCSGSITSSDRKIQRVEKIFESDRHGNYKTILDFIGTLQPNYAIKSFEDIVQDISKNIPEYEGYGKYLEKNGSIYWPTNGHRLLYDYGFNFEDKEPRFIL
jgi:formate dehydrogenase major subunit